MRLHTSRAARKSIRLAALSAIAATAFLSSAHAADRFWDPGNTDPSSGGTGTWDAASTNWDTLQTGGTNQAWNNTANTDVAVFGNTAGTVTLNRAATTNADGLRFDVGGYTLNPNAAATDTITFGGTNAIDVTASATTGNVVITNALVLNAASTFTNNGGGSLQLNLPAAGITGATFGITADGSGNTTINGLIGTTTGGLTKNGAGVLTLSGAANTYTGTTAVSTGRLDLNKAAGTTSISGNALNITGGEVRLLAANQIVDGNVATLTNAAILNLNGNNETIARLVGTTATAAQVQLGAGTLTFGDGTAATFAGVISGAGGITKQGTATVTLNNTNTYSGTTTVNGGTLLITGATGTLGSTTTLNAGGIVRLDNATASNTNRINDAAPVNLGGTSTFGSIDFIGNAAAGTYTENLGTLSLVNFQGVVNVSNGAAGATTSTVAFSGIGARSAGAVIDVTSSGGTLGGGAGNPNVTVTGLPTTNGIVGGFATVAGTNWATVGANGIEAFSAYVPLAGALPNQNADLTGSATVASNQTINTLRIAPTAAGQTLTLGGGNLTLATDALLYVGGGNDFTIAGANSLTVASELIAHVQSNTLTINAPINFTGGTPRLTKAGAGTLVLPVSGAGPAFFANTVNVAGTLNLNSTAGTQTIAGVVQGTGNLTKSGPGAIVLSNVSNSYAGGTTVTEGVLEMQNAAAAPQGVTFNGTATTSLIGNQASGVTTLNGGTLKLTTKGTGSIALGESVTFGANGGVLEMINLNTGTTQGGNIGSGDLPVVTTTGATGTAVIRFNGGQVGLSNNSATDSNWVTGTNALRFSGITNNGPIRVEITNGAMFRNSIATVNNVFTIRGVVGGDPSSGPSGTTNTGLSTTTGRVGNDSVATYNFTQGLFLEGALQFGNVGAARAIDGNITVSGSASGAAGNVSFTGRSTGTTFGSNNPVLQAPGGTAVGLNVLYIGVGGNDTLTIENGGIAALDLRHRSDQSFHHPPLLNARAVIQAGGTLVARQSFATTTHSVGFAIVQGNIEGQGSTAAEAVFDILLPFANSVTAGTTAGGDQRGGIFFADGSTPGGQNYGAAMGVIVNGTGTGGLMVKGSPRPNALFNPVGADPVSNLDKVNNLLTPTRLAGLTGTGGYLTPAPTGATFVINAGSEWAANVPVGLKAVDSNAGGDDVQVTADFQHNVHVDTGATMNVSNIILGPAVAAAGLGRTSGTGTLVGPVTIHTGGTLAPGSSPGTLSVNGNITVNGAFEVEVTGPAAGQFDVLAITGDMTLGAASVMTNPSSTFDGVSSYVIATYTGTLTGSFLSTPNLPAPYEVNYGTRNNGVITLVPIPEPSALLGAVVAAGLLAARRRRPA